MAGTIIEYLKEYGDCSFAEKPFNDVDSLALCQLSYLKFDGLVPDVRQYGPWITLLELSRHPDFDKLFTDEWYEKSNRALVSGMLSGRRFRELKMNCYINLVEKEWETQFSAITFMTGNGLVYIAFRGTDETIVGWKEDFNMSFAAEVPAQGAALDYVTRAAGVLDGPLVLGGHSKGGNLAAYAGIFAPRTVQERIQCVYNFDGPGFNEAVLATEQFQSIDMRIHTFVPQTSVVGILLWHAELLPSSWAADWWK